MIKRIRKIKHPEEFFGAIGLAYFLILTGVAFILVRFIVTIATDSIRSIDSSSSLPPIFHIEQAEELIQKQAEV